MKIRMRWSDFNYYEPIKVIITDWNNLKRIYNRYMIVDAVMEYRGREIELCVPYHRFVQELMRFDIRTQKNIVYDHLPFVIEKTYKFEHGGMIIRVDKNDILPK